MLTGYPKIFRANRDLLPKLLYHIVYLALSHDMKHKIYGNKNLIRGLLMKLKMQLKKHKTNKHKIKM